MRGRRTVLRTARTLTVVLAGALLVAVVAPAVPATVSADGSTWTSALPARQVALALHGSTWT